MVDRSAFRLAEVTALPVKDSFSISTSRTHASDWRKDQISAFPRPGEAKRHSF